MSPRFTVLTLNEPDPAAMAWAIAEINADFYLVIDQKAERWEVYDVDDTTLLFTIDTPYYVQVPGEIERAFGSTAGFNFDPLGGEAPTFWQDVHAVEGSDLAASSAARYAQLAAHLGLGTAVEHAEVFKHLGEDNTILRKEWKV
jgi:hypothetical protein